MILIADSGSTKTEWALVSKNETDLFKTSGMNPYFVTTNELLKIKEILLKSVNNKSVTNVFFFGAGCNSTEKKNVIEDFLNKTFPDSKIEIESDLLGAAKALFGKNNGIAVILGTGASSGYFNGNEITFKTESLGYILGDEGSGTYIGKHFITNLLYGNFSKEIENNFKNEFGIWKPEILENVYSKANANKYLASFTYFIKENIKNKQVKAIVENAFDDLITNHLLKYPEIQNTKVGFVGSIANVFSEILFERCNVHNIKIQLIVAKPIMKLVEFYK